MGCKQRLRILTSNGMITHVSRATMHTADKSARKAGGRSPIRGASHHETSMLAGQTPTTVTRAIFQRGGDTGTPGGENQYSKPLSRRYDGGVSLNGSAFFSSS